MGIPIKAEPVSNQTADRMLAVVRATHFCLAFDRTIETVGNGTHTDATAQSIGVTVAVGRIGEVICISPSGKRLDEQCVYIQAVGCF